jgi:transglutaminase-like putative cysteine protease
VVQAWAPLQSVNNNVWARSLGETWSAPGARVAVHDVNGARLLHASWAPGVEAPQLSVTTRFASKDRTLPTVDSGVGYLSHAERERYTSATRFAPVEGRIRELFEPVVAGANSDLARVRAIYEWMVANTFRDGAVRGCGTGDVNSMLASGHFGGKCADLNTLFVCACRSAGIPAREIYGVRVSASRFGYHSLGPSTPIVTRAQHCRAEVFIDRLGWIAADPADVRKVMLEEAPGGLPLDDVRVAAVRGALFGAAEGNWLPFNSARDVSLPGSTGDALAFLMYPQVERNGRRADSLSPDTATYSIEAQEIA